jgi:hypothetical protein
MLGQPDGGRSVTGVPRESVVHGEVGIDLIGDRYARLALRAAVEVAAKGEPVYLADRGKRVAVIVAAGEDVPVPGERCEW